MKPEEIIDTEQYLVAEIDGVAESMSGEQVIMFLDVVVPNNDQDQVIIIPMKQALAAPEMLEKLKEIAKGDGAYDMDQLKYAGNCIENMKSLALGAIKSAE